jgi:hypothetical protein
LPKVKPTGKENGLVPLSVLAPKIVDSLRCVKDLPELFLQAYTTLSTSKSFSAPERAAGKAIIAAAQASGPYLPSFQSGVKLLEGLGDHLHRIPSARLADVASDLLGADESASLAPSSGVAASQPQDSGPSSPHAP